MARLIPHLTVAQPCESVRDRFVLLLSKGEAAIGIRYEPEKFVALINPTR
jgi:hypothetical protein